MTLYSSLVARLLFPLHERVKRHDTVRIRGALDASQWYSAEALRGLQGERLRSFLGLVAARVPFYRGVFRERGLSPDDFGTPESLTALPLVDKRTIRANFDAWTAEGAQGLTRHQTSGSSGEPLHFLLGRHRISFDIAAKWRAMRWWDVDLGDREVVLWGSHLEAAAQDRLRALRDRVFRSRLVPARDLSPERLDDILHLIQASRPRMLFGYPSALSRLAFRALDTGRRMDDAGVRVAFCTAEVLRPEWRAAIASAFGCGVANEYGARDAGFIARECPAGGLHVTAEELIVEIVDATGTPLPAGEEGDIVVTNLAGPEFPFIRYRTGDRGVLASRPCACGRGLPLLAAVCGRANDGLVTLAGGWVHASAVNYALREIPGLQGYRVIQESRHRVRILVVLPTELPDAIAVALTRHVRMLLGESVQVAVERVEQIAPEPNGKYRHVVCLVEPSDAAQTSAVQHVVA